MKPKNLVECSTCGSVEPQFVFNVRRRTVLQRFCTTCILNNHPGLFCPICFEVYNDPPPVNERAICLNCPSISHLSCAAASDASSRYQCPPCANPDFSYFNFDGEGGLTQDLAKQLMAAAIIASVTMNKAAAFARAEAERAVLEALAAKKRAKEALERLVSLTYSSTSPACMDKFLDRHWSKTGQEVKPKHND